MYKLGFMFLIIKLFFFLLIDSIILEMYFLEKDIGFCGS